MSKRHARDRNYAISTLIAGLALVVLGISNNVPFLKGAQDYTTEIAANAGLTYASLRGINAALSFVEEVEVSGSVVVASGSVNPFKFLEPIDDAVERLSTAVFLIGVISAILSVVLAFIGKLGFLLMGLALIAGAILLLSGRTFPGKHIFLGLLERIFNLGFLSFLLVLAFFLSSILSASISERAWDDYSELLEDIGTQSATIEGPDGGWSAAKEKFEFAQDFVGTILAKSDELVEAIIAVFAAFLFKTIVLPVLVAVGLIEIFRTSKSGFPVKAA